MSPIPWDPRLETGETLVDQQHQSLHDLFNELESAENRPEEVGHVLQRLLEHAAFHFATEEELMQRVGYPESLATHHVELHRELTSAARQKTLEFRSGELTDTTELLAFLRQWIVEHIHEQDRVLVEWVRAQRDAAVDRT